jgi:hypothetical protein
LLSLQLFFFCIRGCRSKQASKQARPASISTHTHTHTNNNNNNGRRPSQRQCPLQPTNERPSTNDERTNNVNEAGLFIYSFIYFPHICDLAKLAIILNKV